MPRANRSADAGSATDTGSAALEFVLAGVLLLVPLVYLVLALGQIQAHALGAESGARHIARAIASASGPAAADARAQAVLAATIAEYDLAPDSVRVTLSCVPATATCPEAGGTVVVTVSARARLPLVPGVLGLDRVASVPVEASAAQRVSRFWGAG
ncbi:TadE family protein [Microbacterium sp. HA-8]|uniref:TadE family protein n=1 Tax=Microbacterium sp. HA-8 TaxID=3234200 RepID=UPI0038F6DA7B